MPKKGQMSDQDAADEVVRNNAAYYNVVLHVPQTNSRVQYVSEELDAAIRFAEGVYDDPNQKGVRCAMVYAVDENDHFALVGTTNQFKNEYKPVVVKVY